jgi:hypothetical protein
MTTQKSQDPEWFEGKADHELLKKAFASAETEIEGRCRMCGEWERLPGGSLCNGCAVVKQEPEDPINVRVARALGCTPVYVEEIEGPTEGPGGPRFPAGWICRDGKHSTHSPYACREYVHDYLHDAAFLLRVVIGNHLCVYHSGTEWAGGSSTSSDCLRRWADTLEIAILEWLIAAKAAGLEVRGV